MEQIKTQMNMADKIKRYTILPLMAMGVFMGGFSSNAHADPLDAKQMDAETVSKTLLNSKIIGTITDSQKEEALEAFEKNAKKHKIPKEIIKLVTKNTILDQELVGNKAIMYMDKGTVIFMIRGIKSGTYSGAPAIRLYDVQPEHIAEPLPPVSKGINTKTKKPYFSIPKGVGAKLSPSDKEYLKKLYKVMNSNFGTMMPLYQLDTKKLAQNKYAGKIPDLAVLGFGEIPSLEKGMDETEIALRRQLGFVINGAAEMMKAGGKLSYTAGDCTGWTYHSITLNDNSKNFLVFNGAYNPKGSIGQYRVYMLNRKAGNLRFLQKGFKAIMEENGVELGTDPKAPGLTPKQQIIAGWGNALQNYANALNFEKASLLNSQKIKTLDEEIGPEDTTVPKVFNEITVPGVDITSNHAGKKPIYLARISCDFTR